MRCSVCGRPTAGGDRCSACGEPLASSQTRVDSPSIRPAIANSDRAITRRDSPSALAPVGARTPRPVVALQRTDGSILGSEVRGRVLLVRPGPNEPMDLDPWRLLAIPVWGLVLLVAPVAAGVITWMVVGFLPAVGVFAVCVLVLRYMFSERLLYGWQFVAALRGRYVVEPMPVLAVRLREENERESQLRVKGHLTGGTIVEGDRIAAQGSWSRGVFHVRRIICERTGAIILPQQPTALGLAITGSVIFVAISAWLYVWGIPWTLDRAHEFRDSVEQRVSVPSLNQNGGRR
jgi:hypothetical protein